MELLSYKHSMAKALSLLKLVARDSWEPQILSHFVDMEFKIADTIFIESNESITNLCAERQMHK